MISVKHSMLLERRLRQVQGGQSITILGGDVYQITKLANRAFPSAAMRLIVGNARDYDDLRSRRDVSKFKIVVGSDIEGSESTDDVVILHIVGFEGKDPIQQKIGSAWRRLTHGGMLIVLTTVRHGARSQRAEMEKIFGSVEAEKFGADQILVARAQKSQAEAQEHLSQLVEGKSKFCVEIMDQTFEFYTTSAVFSKDRIDPGSRVLLESLPLGCARSFLDIGCGYGVIGIVAARLNPRCQVTLVDIDARAVELSIQNVSLNQVNANTRVVLSDGLRQISGERFDLAAIHFPLHIPRRELERLLTEIHAALFPGGCLYGVILGAYELRPLVRGVFGEIETVKETCEQESEFVYRIIRAYRR